jgi:hypothetical protein
MLFMKGQILCLKLILLIQRQNQEAHLLIVARVSSMTSISSCPSHPPSSNSIFSYPPVPLISRSILCCHKITWRLDPSKLDILDCNVSLPILIHFNMIAATSYSPCTQAFDATCALSCMRLVKDEVTRFRTWLGTVTETRLN